MEAKGLRPIDWKTYFYASTQKSTIDSSALNCTCGQCRDLGYATFEELRAIVDDLREAAREAALELPSGLLTRLEKRVVCLERFMQHGYARLLQEQSSNARLCVRMALTTAHDHHFKQPCEHPRSDATVGEAPRSMSDEMRHAHNREPVDADWEVDCGSCAKLAGKVYLCDGCNVVCCMDCVKMKMNDVDTRDDVAEEVAEDDSVESNIGDSGGGGGGDDDNNARFSTGWRCPQCQLLHDAMRHSNDDPEVNELEWALEDIQRVVEALPTTQAEDTSEDGDSDDRTWLLTRLAEVCENLERLRAHKLRTWYFSRFKAHVLELVKNDPTLAFDLSDYWGKLPPRKAQEACGEGTQSGMSVHGSYFVIQNPPLALRNQHQDVDWSLWPPPPEEAAEGSAVQSDFVVLNFQVLCDDARQTPYSVRCVKELQYERIGKEMPWLKSVYGQSDQCDDYHSTQAVIAFSQLGRGESLKLRIVEHGHTEPGEGKNVVDMKCGQGKQDLARDRDAGNNHEDADEIFDGLERRRRVGDYYTVMEIDRSKEQQKKKPALPNIHDYEHSTYSDNGDIVCREAWGYGPGRRFSKEEVEKHDQHMLGDPGTGATAVKSSESLVPKSQFSNGQRTEARAEKRRKASGKADLAQKKKDADKAAIEEERGVDKSQTCKCGHTLLTPGAMQAHKNAGCGQSQRRRAAQQRSRPTVSQFMSRMVNEATVERELERRELALVTVELPRNLAGLSFERDVCSTIRVASVSGEAAASLVVAEGYALLTIDGNDVADGPSSSINAAVEAALGAADGEMATFVFERPSPPLPPHGWARKAMRRQANARFTTQQKAFLDRHFESSLKGGERMREKKVYKLMKTELGRKLGADGRSLVLTQAQIRGYFSRRAASMKRSAVDAVIGGDDGDNGNDEDVGDGDDEYESFKIPELKAMLREKSLDEKGRKAELIARLRADDEDLVEAEPAPKRQRR
jgi:hypothetical protein